MIKTALLLVPALLAASFARADDPALPYTPVLDVASMDKTVDPCVDLYTYSCGGWMKANPLPADRSSYSVYAKLDEDNIAYLRGVLDQAASSKKRDKVTTEIGDFYAACMDEAGADKRGAKPLASELKAIAHMKKPSDLAEVAARLNLETGDPQVLFSAGSAQDPDDSES